MEGYKNTPRRTAPPAKTRRTPQKDKGKAETTKTRKKQQIFPAAPKACKNKKQIGGFNDGVVKKIIS